MDLISFGKTLSNVLPKLKTSIQLTGLVVGLAFALIANFSNPGDTTAMLTGGSVGISIIIFGQLFHFLKDFDRAARPLVFLVSFGMFCVFTLSLLAMTIFSLKMPSVTVTDFHPSLEIKKKLEETKPTDPNAASTTDRRSLLFNSLSPEKWLIGSAEAAPIGQEPDIIELPSLGDSRALHKAEYAFSEKGGIPTLSATFKYTEASRTGKYPNGDFHNGDDWGSPWLSLKIANPTSDVMYFTSLKVDAEEIVPINDVILDVPNIEHATKDNAVLEFRNMGWGRAKQPTLELMIGRRDKSAKNRYTILRKKSYVLPDFEDMASVSIGDLLPPIDEWEALRGSASGICANDKILWAIGRLSYIDDAGQSRSETFRTSVMTCIDSGGNVGPSAYYNINLPTAKQEFPLFMNVSTCIAGKSADHLVVHLTSLRSTRYKLKFSLITTDAKSIERRATVDILVPRKDISRYYADGKFFEDSKSAGCS